MPVCFPPPPPADWRPIVMFTKTSVLTLVAGIVYIVAELASIFRCRSQLI